MKTVILLITVLLPLAGAGCGKTGLNNVPTIEKKQLADLRTSLDLVRSASKDRPFVAPTYDPSSLIGLSRSQISSVLGAPNTCDSMMMAPCEKIGDWFYSYYKLPENYVGGGPELLLQFGRDDVCSSARWVLTQ